MDYSLLLIIEENSQSIIANTQSIDMNWAREMLKFESNIWQNNDIPESQIDSRSSQINGMSSLYKINSDCGKYFYYIGIIDYLQPYDFWKKTERVLKSIKI
jgi:hypothetical protein